jgi:hypothetical protein
MIIQIWTLNISQPFIYLTLMQATINYIFMVFQMWKNSSQSISPWPCIRQNTPYSNRISAHIWIFTLNIRYRTNWISLPEYPTNQMLSLPHLTSPVLPNHWPSHTGLDKPDWDNQSDPRR